MATEKITQEARISVLEHDVTNVKHILHKMEKDLEFNTKMTFEIKERLDKQNGTLPHLAEDVKELLKQQRELSEKVVKQEKAQDKVSVKIKVLWAGAGVIATALLGYALKVFLGG